MYKLLVSGILSLGLFGFASTALEAAEHVCCQPIVSMHKEPKELSEVVSQIIWSDSVEVIEVNDNDWALIASKDMQQGWVPVSTLVELEDGIYPQKNKVATVTSKVAHVYLVRDVAMYPPLLSLPYGAKLEVLNGFDLQGDRWIEVQLVNGEVAYIQRTDVAVNPKPLSKNEMVALATSLIGVPYTWGGSSVYGFDSSGFVQMMYRQMGVVLPRGAYDQAAIAPNKHVAVSDLEPGDLLFFSLKDDGLVDHVGIYLGNNEFLHASTRNAPPSVQVTPIRTPYWQASLKKCWHVESK